MVIEIIDWNFTSKDFNFLIYGVPQRRYQGSRVIFIWSPSVLNVYAWSTSNGAL